MKMENERIYLAGCVLQGLCSNAPTLSAHFVPSEEFDNIFDFMAAWSVEISKAVIERLENE